jgi:hypothetical protein
VIKSRTVRESIAHGFQNDAVIPSWPAVLRSSLRSTCFSFNNLLHPARRLEVGGHHRHPGKSYDASCSEGTTGYSNNYFSVRWEISSFPPFPPC